MGSLGDRLRPYLQPRPRRVQGRVVAAPPAGPGPPQPAVGDRELARRSEELSRELARLTWDLGGLTYEMAIRDHFRVDVLVRQAAKLQQVDAELGSIERLMRLEQAGAAGECPVCAALYPRGAAYCSQCGGELMGTVSLAPSPPGPPPPQVQPPPQLPQLTSPPAPAPAAEPPASSQPPPTASWPPATVGQLR
jgi:hypothetical protein